MRRAISTAYYAVFRTQAVSNAQLFAGQPATSLSTIACERVYRPLDHGRAQRNLRKVVNQLSRQGARFDRAQTAVNQFAQLSQDEQRFMAARSMFDKR